MKFLSQINVNTEYTLPFVDGTNGQVLTTDGNGAVYWSSSAGVTNLNALTDVELTSPSTGQILRYEIPLGGSVPVWRNVTPGYLDPNSSINALGDVVITSATSGQILQFNGTFWINTTLSTVEYVSKVQHTVKAGVAISKGQAVYVTTSDGTNMVVGLASNASEATSSKVIGLAASNAAINDQIFVVTEGLLAGLNTSTATAGDPVWLGTNGNLIFGLLNKPVAPAHLVYIGVVTRVQSNNGEIFVNVQNGFELNEIHDALIVSPTAGQLLRRDSDNLWKNWTPNYLTAEADTLATVTARGATTTGNIVVNGEISLPSFIRLTNAGANNAYISESWGINLNGASTHPIQVRSASLSVGYTLGAGTSYGSGNLFVSDKIGVNTTAPTKALDVVGSGIVASFGSAFSTGSFAGIHFGYSETQYGNDNYKKSALVFERTDNHIGQGSNASGKIHFLLNNAGGTSATSLSHSVVTIDSNANGTAGTARVGIGRTSPFYALDVNGQTNSTSFVSTSILILDADLNQSQQPQQGDPANKIYSFRWAGNEQGYIDTDAKITFAGFKTPTGTASQFLKANGTVDSNVYITSAALSGYATQTWVNSNFYNQGQIDDFFYGNEPILGYNKTNWDAAYADKINSASFSTTTGVLTLTQQDAGTITVDLDGRYLESLPSHTHAASDITSGTLSTDRLPKQELGISIVGNFGQWQLHSAYTNFNTPVNYWGWNYVQGNTNAPHQTSSQWYRGRFSLGNEYGFGNDPGDYWMEIAIPRYNLGDNAGNLFVRTAENGTIGGWQGVRAAYATNANYATSAGDSTNLGGLSSARYAKQDYYNEGYNWDTIGAANTDSAIVLRVESSASNPPAGDVYNWSLWQQGTKLRGSQIAVSAYGEPRMFFRGADGDNNVYASWNEIIHSGNIASQTIGYASQALQVIGQSGQNYSSDNRTISPSEISPGYLQFGFTSWGNNSTSPWADYLHMRSYTDGSGGSDNLVMFKKSGIGMRIWQQTFGSSTAYSSYADVWTTENFSSTNVTNWNTAYGWGNHADAPYWNVTLTDDVSVSASSVRFGGNVRVDGDLEVLGTITETSSIRFKENIAPLDPALDKVNQLEAVSYNKIGVDDREIGLIAEDVAELFPEVVTYNEEGQPQGIQYQRLSVILLKAVQELTERVNKLENK